jgi:hypothetical protein
MIELIIIYKDCSVTFTIKDLHFNKRVVDGILYVDLLLQYPNIADLALW